jgi:ABC-type molybdate transport system permease subunit
MEQEAEILGVTSLGHRLGLIALVKNEPGGTKPLPVEIYSSLQWFEPLKARRYIGSAVVSGVLFHAFYLDNSIV